MEELIGINLTFDLIVGWLINISLLLLTLLALIMVRQAGLMNRVVNYPIGGSLKTLVWGYAFICMLITVIVILV
jgi:hypothetical protein